MEEKEVYESPEMKVEEVSEKEALCATMVVSTPKPM